MKSASDDSVCGPCAQKPCLRMIRGPGRPRLVLFESFHRVPGKCPALASRHFSRFDSRVLEEALGENEHVLQHILGKLTPTPALVFKTEQERRRAAVEAVLSGRIHLLFAPWGSAIHHDIEKMAKAKHKALATAHREVVEAEEEARELQKEAEKPKPELVGAAWRMPEGTPPGEEKETHIAAPLETIGCEVDALGLMPGDPILFHVFLKGKAGTGDVRLETVAGRLGEKTRGNRARVQVLIPERKHGHALEPGKALYFLGRHAKLGLEIKSPLLALRGGQNAGLSAPPALPPVQAKPPQSTTLLLDHRYHDDTPVAEAEYEVELENGQLVRGRLNKEGRAEIRGLGSKPLRVRYGPDARPYAIADDSANPAYIAHFTKADAHAYVDAARAGRISSTDSTAFAIEAVDWIWGTVKGGFGEKQTVSQILVDAMIGMIPLVGEVTAVRDLMALILGMAQDPKRRESKLEWLALAVLLFALVPVVGGAIKGVGKLLLKGGREAAGASNHLREMVAHLNRLGLGDAVKWLSGLHLEGWVDEALGIWQERTHRIMMVLDSIQSQLKGVLPQPMLAHLAGLKEQIVALSRQGETMIPGAVRELSERLKAAQRHMYQGEWHEIPKNLASNTWETEARLVDVPGGKKWVVEKMPYPPNGPESFVSQDGWPDLLDETNWKYVEVDTRTKFATYKVISCFSGPMRPVRIPAGTRIHRIIQDKDYAAGDWWVYSLPESGVEWREGLAVLDSWNGNGLYVEMTVPEGGLLAWEGKAAGQVENSPKAQQTRGQYLEGGKVQLFIDLKFGANTKAVKNISNPIETHWTGHTGLHVPLKETQAEFLNAFEFASKIRMGATTAEKAGRPITDDEEK